jgi:flagellar M-ring protein FliF
MPKFFEQLLAVWKKLEANQKLIISLALVALVIAFVVIGYTATRPDFKLLVRDLRPAQAAEIAAYLDSNHVAYQVIDNESAVMVPSKDLYRLRNELAEREMLGDGSHGFELLAQGHMWDSTFAEHKNYDRAVQGELERSFREINGVQSARVIIDRPAASPFLDDDGGRPKASIKVNMKPGVRLTQPQISGIIHLTSGAVVGMTPDRVQVMDGGGLLTQSTQDSGAMMAQTSMDAEIARESYLTRRAQDLLDSIVGPGRSSVKVAVKLDFTKRTEASTEPRGSLVVKENITTSDEKTPVFGIGGVAGTAPNVEGESSTASNKDMSSKTSEETKNEYKVGQKTVTQEDEIGRIKGMTVSILLDYKITKVTKTDDKGVTTTEDKREKYSDQEVEQFKKLVLSAIGFDTARGIQSQTINDDAVVAKLFSVEAQSMDMHHDEPEAVAQATMLPSWIQSDLKNIIGYGAAGLVALIMLFIARGQLKKSQKAWSDAQEKERAAQEERDRRSARESADPGNKTKRQELKEVVRKKVQENPAAAAQILRKWINE